MNGKGNTPHDPECKIGWLIQSLLMLALFFLALELVGQQQSGAGLSAKGQAEGSLRVTLTVQSSVGIVMDKDGQPQVMVANAPDVKDGVVYLKEAGAHRSSGAPRSANGEKPPSTNTDIPAQKPKANQAREPNTND